MARYTDLTNRDAQPSGDVQEYVEPEYCEYCGAPLNPMLYFCPSCATPFKSVERVIPPHRPRKLTGEELINLKAPRVAPLVWTYVCVIFFTGVFSFAFFADNREGFQIYFASVVFFVTTAIIAAIYWRSLVTQFKRLGFVRWEAWVGLAILAPALGVNLGYHWFIDFLLRGAGYDVDAYAEGLNELGIDRAMLILMFCVLPAVTEEIGFRGLVQHWLQVAIKPWHAIFVASALFAAVHFSLLSFPYLFGVGVLLGWVKYRTGSLYPSMLIHFVHNLIVIEYFWQVR